MVKGACFAEVAGRTSGFAAAFAAALVSAVASAETLTGDLSLASDKILSEDLTVNGTVAMSPGVKLDLNGHVLTAHGVKEAEGGYYTETSGDLTKPDGTIADCSPLESGYSGATLFNNNTKVVDSDPATKTTRRILKKGPISTDNSFHVTYDFGEGVRLRVTSYNVWYGQMSGTAGRAPKDWKLEGSNDRDSWTPVDSRSGVTNWGAPKTNAEKKSYACVNPGSYRYYRFTCTATVTEGEYIEIVQLEYLGTATPVVGNPDATKDLTTPFGTATGNADSGYSAANLFNNNFTSAADTTHRILKSNISSIPFEVVYDFGEGNRRKVASYKVWFGQVASYVKRGPKVWKLEGSDTGGDDDGDWAEVDSRSGVTWNNAAVVSKSYTCKTPGYYRYYRWTCTANNDTKENILEMTQLEYFTDVAGNGGVVINTPAVSTVENTKVKIGESAATFEKTDEGTFSSSKALAHTGATTVSGGTLALGVNGVIPSASAVAMQGGTVNLGGHSQTVASLSGTGTVSNGTLTVSGAINPGTDASTPAKLAFGDITLAGTLVLDASAAGLDGISVVSGTFALGGLGLQINNIGDLPIGKYRIASSTGGSLSGVFKSKQELPPKWYEKQTDKSFFIYTLGTQIFLR